MWGILAVSMVLVVIAASTWKLCLAPQPCKMRSVARRRIASTKTPRELGTPEPVARVKSPEVRLVAPRVGAGTSTLLSRRHAQNVAGVPPLPPRSEMRVSTVENHGRGTGPGRAGIANSRSVAELTPRSENHTRPTAVSLLLVFCS